MILITIYNHMLRKTYLKCVRILQFCGEYLEFLHASTSIINSLKRITISINGLFLGQDTRFRQIKYHMGVLQAPRYSIELRG